MRFLLFVSLALLTVLATAQEQVPLADRVQGWFNKAKEYIPTATPVVPSVQKVAEKQKLPEKAVTPFSLNTWHSALEPSSEAQDWLLFITGGNKTCFGRCDRAEKAFNQSIPLFAADKKSPNLGYLDCENNQVLCSAWGTTAPSVRYFRVPQAQLGEERPATALHCMTLNATTVTPEDIFKIYSEERYNDVTPYEGVLHPTDGALAKNGLLIPIGYAIYGLSVIPSWAFMIGISFISRTFMGRRVNPGPARPAQAARPN